MTANPPQHDLSDNELARKFMEFSLREYDAHYADDVKQINRLRRRKKAIVDALDAHGPSARQALLPLLDHANAQVRLDAATYLKSREPQRAFATLRDIAANGPGVQRGMAGMSLYYSESGIGKPP